MPNNSHPLSSIAVVPAAGIGKRMQSDKPKQYLTIQHQAILSITINKLLAQPEIARVVVVVNANDEFFPLLDVANNPKVDVVIGGAERVDSVLAGLQSINSQIYPWVLVHDAARPCVQQHDISRLMATCLTKNTGGILATPVRDTMKRALPDQQNIIAHTESRQHLWHALTPQFFPTQQLISAIERAQQTGIDITDESSAIEAAGYSSVIVEGAADNIKVTTPADLALAEFILAQQVSNSSTIKREIS